MKKFLQQNKIAITFIIGAILIASTVYLALSDKMGGKEGESGENGVSCLGYPDFAR